MGTYAFSKEKGPWTPNFASKIAKTEGYRSMMGPEFARQTRIDSIGEAMRKLSSH